MASNYSIINIAAYKFVTLNADEAMRIRFQQACVPLGLKGTILLTPEGINLFLAGTRTAVDAFMTWLKRDPVFADLQPKESGSSTQPFKRMLVKLKPEIITMRRPLIKPELQRAPAVTALVLKRWLDDGHDDAGRPIVMLDTRNGFEVEVGTFDGTVNYGIEKFSDFPDIATRHQADFNGKTVVTFCTGGIRCEKAAIHMRNVGFESVYQLDGGILKYFEDVGAAHYTGDCFVFDNRTALDPSLAPMTDTVCARCGAVVPSRDRIGENELANPLCRRCKTLPEKNP